MNLIFHHIVAMTVKLTQPTDSAAPLNHTNCDPRILQNFFDTHSFDMRHLFTHYNVARPNASKVLLWAPYALVTFHFDVSIQSAPLRDINFPILFSTEKCYHDTNVSLQSLALWFHISINLFQQHNNRRRDSFCWLVNYGMFPYVPL